MLRCPNCNREFLEGSSTTWEKKTEKPVNEVIHGGSTVGYKTVYEQHARCPHCGHTWIYGTREPESKVKQAIQQIINTPPALWKAAWKKLWEKIFC